MPIIYEPDENRRQLIKTSEHEAVDLQTGTKYKLERVDEQTSVGAGILIGILLTFMFWVLLRSGTSTPQQPRFYEPTAPQIILPSPSDSRG